MNIKTSSQCEACKTCNLHTETTNHKFYECLAVKGFWSWCRNWWNFKHPENLTPSAREILYGYKPESTSFHAFDHSNCTILLILHPPSILARTSLRHRDSMISLFFWKLLNFNVKEKLLLKPETTPNKEISGPPYASLICVRKPHQIQK